MGQAYLKQNVVQKGNFLKILDVFLGFFKKYRKAKKMISKSSQNSKIL